MEDDQEPRVREPRPLRQHAVLSALVQEYQQALGSYLLQLTGEPAVALRLTEETFVCAERAQVGVRSNLAMRPWLFRIATQLAYRHLRQQRAARRLSRLRSDRKSSARAGAADAERALVRSVLLDLRVAERTVLLLCDYAELPLDEVAAILDLSADRLRQRLERARAHFRLTYVERHASDEQGQLPPR